MRQYNHRRTRKLGVKAATPDGIFAPFYLFGGFYEKRSRKQRPGRLQVWRTRQLPGLPKQKEMSYAYYNLNPAGKSVGDCTVRALSKALGQTWNQTYIDLCLEGYMRGDLPNADSIWGSYLSRRGYVRRLLPDECPDCYTVEDFARDNPRGTFILSMPGRHVVTVVDGTIYDSWDSRNECPVYYWAKKEGTQIW